MTTRGDYVYNHFNRILNSRAPQQQQQKSCEALVNFQQNRRENKSLSLDHERLNYYCYYYYCVICLVVLFFCVNVSNGEASEKEPIDYFYPNHENCGNREEIPGDIRSMTPWNAAIFVKRNPESPFKYFVTGAIIGETTILSIYGGGYGYPVRKNNKPRKYLIPSPENYIVVTGLKSTNLSDADEYTQISQVTFINPSRMNSQENTDYHFVIYRLKTRLNFNGAHVRPACIPYGILPTLRAIILNGTYREIINISDEKSNIGGFDVGHKTPSGSAPLTFMESRSSLDYNCMNRYKYHYNYRPDWITCTHSHLTRQQHSTEKNATCFSHGSLSLWKSTRYIISVVPSLGPSERWHISGLIALIPRNGGRKCNVNTTYFVAVTHSSNDWIKHNVICPPTSFPCTNGKCIPLDQLCDGKVTCEDGSDEDSVFCDATFRCTAESVNDLQIRPLQPRGHSRHQGKPNKYYQCGYEGKCITSSQVGDNKRDCPSGSDEDETVVKIFDSSEKPVQHRYFNDTKILDSKNTMQIQQCFPIIVGEGVVVECYEPTGAGRRVSCFKASIGTMATLTCAEFYTSRIQSSFITMTCDSDSKWKPFRRFQCTPECGLLGPETQQPLIAHGNHVPPSSSMFSWHAAILRDGDDSGNFKYVCGASLIEKNVLLSAAHCITDKSSELLPFTSFRVVINPMSNELKDDNSEYDPERLFNVEESWIPWTYNSLTLHSDIAIIKIDRPVSYSKSLLPICYLVKSFQHFPEAGSKGKVPGYGLTENKTVSKQLKFVELTVTATPDCNSESPGTFCANSKSGKPAQGDSGGGLVLPSQILYSQSATNRHVIKGIVSSWRKPVEDSSKLIFTEYDSEEEEEVVKYPVPEMGQYTRFTHVDSHAEWVLNTLEKIDTNPEPSTVNDKDKFSVLPYALTSQI